MQNLSLTESKNCLNLLDDKQQVLSKVEEDTEQKEENMNTNLDDKMMKSEIDSTLDQISIFFNEIQTDINKIILDKKSLAQKQQLEIISQLAKEWTKIQNGDHSSNQSVSKGDQVLNKIDNKNDDKQQNEKNVRIQNIKNEFNKLRAQTMESIQNYFTQKSIFLQNTQNLIYNAVDSTIINNNTKIINSNKEKVSKEEDLIYNKLGIQCTNSLHSAKLFQLMKQISYHSSLTLLQLDISHNNNSISYSDLSKYIRSQINLTCLDLNLASNSFQNEDMQNLVKGFSSFNKLTSLKLNFFNNKISDLGCEYLHSSLSEIKQQLESLSLNVGKNEVNKQGVRLISQCSLQLKHLDLNLQDNLIDQYSCNEILVAISQMTQISQLSLVLARNKFNSQVSPYVSLILRQLQQLEYLQLDLSGNDLYDKEGKHLTEGLNSQKKLVHLLLDLSNCTLSSQTIILLSSRFNHLIQLKNLSLNIGHNTKLKQDGILSLSNGITQLKSIEKLSINFDGNNIGDKGMKQFCDKLCIVPSLQSVELNAKNNNISKEGVICLSEALPQMKKLLSISLNLSNNSICDEGSENLQQGLIKIKQLATINLNLSNNNISQLQQNQLSKLQFLFSPMIE